MNHKMEKRRGIVDLACHKDTSRDGASASGGSEGEEALLGLLVADGVGGGEVLGDELLRAAAPDLHPHALRLAHLVVARRRCLLLVLPLLLPDQPRLDAVDEPRQLPHRSKLCGKSTGKTMVWNG